MGKSSLRITNADLAAAAVGWRLAHDEICPLKETCSRHQPLSAAVQRDRITEALLADQLFLRYA